MKSKIGLPLAWSQPFITLLLFLLAKKFGGGGLHLSWLTVSQMVSLLGSTLLAISFILSGRWRFVEDWFGGMDKVYKNHHLFGGLAFVFLLHHPLLLILDVLPDLNFSRNYLWFSNFAPYNWGILSLYAMMLMLIFTLLLNLPYSLWKKTHEFMGFALLFASLHVLTITSDVSRFLPLRLWLIFLLLVAGYSVIYRRFLYRYLGPKYTYVVKNIRKINDLYDIDMVPSDKKLHFTAGQFVFTRFEAISGEAHPFSLASGPDEESLRIVVKILGDYTWRFDSVKSGSRVVLWGPYGKFGEGVVGDKPLIWVAGGIGVTPFLSLLAAEIKNQNPRQIAIFYCVGSEKEAVFDEELKTLSSQKAGVTFHRYPSDVCGHLDAHKLIELCDGVVGKKIMLCGPISMMNSLTLQL